MIKEAISKIVKNQDLTEVEMIEVMNEIMTGAGIVGNSLLRVSSSILNQY